MDIFSNSEVIIDLENPPKKDQWIFPLLHCKNKLNKIMYWQVGFNGESIETIHGHENGKRTKDSFVVKLNNSSRDINEQAFLNAKQMHNLKIRKSKYRIVGETVSVEDRKPMLAEIYQENIKSINFPYIGQYKLDGIRLFGLSTNSEVVLKSARGNKESKYLFPIRDQLKILFEFLPKNCILDGEAYNHSWDFKYLSSSFKTEKTCHKDNDKIQYHIYDIIILENQTVSYEKRYKILKDAYLSFLEKMGEKEKSGSGANVKSGSGANVKDSNSNLLISLYVLDNKTLNDTSDIENFMDASLKEGYEGIILRNPLSEYINDRTKNLLKYKREFDEEVIITDVVDGEKGRESGLALFLVKDKRGHELRIRPAENFETRREWLKNKGEVIGKRYTIRYQEIFENGKPRNPRGIALRDYEN